MIMLLIGILSLFSPAFKLVMQRVVARDASYPGYKYIQTFSFIRLASNALFHSIVACVRGRLFYQFNNYAILA